MIKGRRWRVSDPRLPEELRQALVDELMSARRAVKAARSEGGPDAERAARDRIHDAKVALGERGVAWWADDPAPDEVADRVRRAARAISSAAELGSDRADDIVDRGADGRGPDDLVADVAAITSYLPAQVATVLAAGADPSMTRVEAVTIGAVEQQPIVLADPDPTWPEVFERRAKVMREALGSVALELHHAGSTSVPGLPAKPIIDVVLVVVDPADEDAYVPALEARGYELRVREPDWYEHRMLRTTGALGTNLHVFGSGCLEVGRMLDFRDHLRGNPDDRDRYAAVKRDLAARRWPTVQHYADAKSEVIASILEAADADQPAD